MEELGELRDALLGPAVLQAVEAAHLGVAVTLVGPAEVKNLYLSDEAVRILGGTREELLAISALARIAPEERARVGEYVERRLRGQLEPELLQTVILRPDGSRLPIATVSSQLTIGGTPASVAFFWDLTELKAAEAQARAEHQRLESLIEASPDGIVINAAGGGRILYLNPAAAALLGLASAADAVNQSLAQWLLPEELPVMRQRMGALERGEKLAPREYRGRRSDGSSFVVEITSRPFVYDGQPANIAFARDVSERARLQEQLTRSHRLAALGTLSAGVAHEINNPLTTSSLTLELLERRLAGLPLEASAAAELAELLGDLRRSTDRVATIVRDLRAFSRPGDEEVGLVDVAQVLMDAERISSHTTRHHAVVRREVSALPKVTGNAGRLEQVFINLLVNAAQALPPGGAANEIRVRGSVTEDGRVVVEVRDNGPGIAPEHLPHLFDPFFTTKSAGGGTGLGLAISHGIVAKLGGQLEVDSQLGVGTTMRVVLPSAVPGPAASPPVVARARPAGARARVLVVDDEPLITTTLKRMLSARHDIEVSNEPALALARLVAGASFDLILCDLMMPGLSGMDLYQQLEVARPDQVPRVVFISGGVLTPAMRGFLAATPNTLLEKPFLSEQVEALIADALAPER